MEDKEPVDDTDARGEPEKYERRSYSVTGLTLEDRHRGAAPTLVGHAAVFNQRTSIGPFDEIIAPGAFTRSLRDSGNPVYALWNHDPNFILASTKNGTLRMTEDNVGLRCEMDPLDTPTIRDLVLKPIQEGMVDKMSFGFMVARGGSKMDYSDPKMPLRTVTDCDLFDVSPVTFPAYSGTDISATRFSIMAGRLERGLPLTEEELKEIRSFIGILSRLAKSQEGQDAGALLAWAERDRERTLAILKGLN